jgi:hypothetical protein
LLMIHKSKFEAKKQKKQIARHFGPAQYGLSSGWSLR